jgi:hypothetical protein
MTTKLYKRTFKGRSVTDVLDEIGSHGGLVLRIERRGDEATAYYESDDSMPLDTDVADSQREVSLDEVTTF